MFSPLAKVTPIKATVLESINKDSMSNLSGDRMQKIKRNSPDIEGKMKKIQLIARKKESQNIHGPGEKQSPKKQR